MKVYLNGHLKENYKINQLDYNFLTKRKLVSCILDNTVLRFYCRFLLL